MIHDFLCHIIYCNTRRLYSVLKPNSTFRCRVSHESWQLVNSFECLLTYTLLDIKDFSQFISLKDSFSQICFTLKSNLLFYECHIIFFNILFGIKQFNKLWKKTFKTIYQLSCFVGHPVVSQRKIWKQQKKKKKIDK